MSLVPTHCKTRQVWCCALVIQCWGGRDKWFPVLTGQLVHSTCGVQGQWKTLWWKESWVTHKVDFKIPKKQTDTLVHGLLLSFQLFLFFWSVEEAFVYLTKFFFVTLCHVLAPLINCLCLAFTVCQFFYYCCLLFSGTWTWCATNSFSHTYVCMCVYKWIISTG